jgi:hypothetical protein
MSTTITSCSSNFDTHSCAFECARPPAASGRCRRRPRKRVLQNSSKLEPPMDRHLVSDKDSICMIKKVQEPCSQRPSYTSSLCAKASFMQRASANAVHRPRRASLAPSSTWPPLPSCSSAAAAASDSSTERSGTCPAQTFMPRMSQQYSIYVADHCVLARAQVTPVRVGHTGSGR